MDDTLDYYNQNAVSFAENTLHVDMHPMQEKFLALLNEGDSILDFGCGRTDQQSARDLPARIRE